MDIKWFGVVTAFTDSASPTEIDSITIGKRYPLHLDLQGAIYFLDDNGDKNYGCDDHDDSVYEFWTNIS